MTEDWADELIFAGIDAETLRRIERKGIAKGMRLIADDFESVYGDNIPDIIKAIRKLADELDRENKRENL